MVQTVTSIWEATPVVSPFTSGILDHATVIEGIAWQRPQGLGLSYNCLDTNVPTELCPEPTTPKEFQPPSLIEGIEFATYGGINCKPFGFDEETGLAEIERVYGLKESRGVERALMETRFIAGPDDDPGAGVDLRWPAATDITPVGGAVSAKAGLALLEGYAASRYAGQPTLHLPYTIASFLAGDQVISAQNGKLFTELGAKVVAGIGYDFPNNGPDGTNPAGSERWLYATGEVVVARSAVKSYAVTDYSTNDQYALAERRYIAAIDCFAAAIRVDVE